MASQAWVVIDGVLQLASIAATGQIKAGNGSSVAPAYTFGTAPAGFGLYRSSNNGLTLTTQSATKTFTLDGDASAFRLANFVTSGWTAGTDSTAALDTGLSRVSAAVIGVGSGAQGDVSGTLRASTIITGGEFQAGTNFLAPTAGAFYWVGKSLIKSSADGVVNLTNQASTTFTRLTLGANDATANGFSFANSAGNVFIGTGDGSGRTGLVVGNIDASGNISAGSAGSFTWNGISRTRISSTSDGIINITPLGAGLGSTIKVDALPTIGSGFGTSPSIVAGSTPFAGAVNVGTGGTATSGIVLFGGTAFPSAPFVVTTAQQGGGVQLASASTTQINISTSAAWPASTIVQWICVGSK